MINNKLNGIDPWVLNVYLKKKLFRIIVCAAPTGAHQRVQCYTSPLVSTVIIFNGSALRGHFLSRVFSVAYTHCQTLDLRGVEVPGQPRTR